MGDTWFPGSGLLLAETLAEALPLGLSFRICAVWDDQIIPDGTASTRVTSVTWRLQPRGGLEQGWDGVGLGLLCILPELRSGSVELHFQAFPEGGLPGPWGWDLGGRQEGKKLPLAHIGQFRGLEVRKPQVEYGIHNLLAV